MKKVLAFVLAAAMLMSMVTFASAEGEKVKLTALFCAHPLTKHVDEMKWVDEIEEAAGVDVTWEVIYTDWNQVKSTRFASGDIPDLLFNATNDSDYTTYKGLFMDLTDLLQYAPNVQAMFEEEPDTLALAKTLEGLSVGLGHIAVVDVYHDLTVRDDTANHVQIALLCGVRNAPLQMPAQALDGVDLLVLLQERICNIGQKAASGGQNAIAKISRELALRPVHGAGNFFREPDDFLFHF